MHPEGVPTLGSRGLSAGARLLTAGLIVTFTTTSCAFESSNASGNMVRKTTSGAASQVPRSDVLSTSPPSANTSRAGQVSTSPGSPAADLPIRTVASVGPLFNAGLASPHGCTAAVVDSPQRDVIVTAAHCISGSGAGVVYAPGYRNGTAPYGTWVVQQAYAPAAWLASGDPAADYAYLVVKPSNTNATNLPVQTVVGGNAVGHAPASGERVMLIGYVAGSNDEAVICTGTVYQTTSYPSVDCPGYADGTSGTPWLTQYDATTGTGTVSAVIGGLNGGGCLPDTSYSSPFTTATDVVLARAASGAPPDTLPAPGPDGC